MIYKLVLLCFLLFMVFYHLNCLICLFTIVVFMHITLDIKIKFIKYVID